MEIVDIKKSLFGYKRRDVCRYISELNEKHSKNMMEKNIQWEKQCQSCKERYLMLEKENIELKSKIDLIGDIILNAEKYAYEIVSQARLEAESIIKEASLQVDQETKRLETAKKYIEKVRKDINNTLSKINQILDATETEIEHRITTL